MNSLYKHQASPPFSLVIFQEIDSGVKTCMWKLYWDVEISGNISYNSYGLSPEEREGSKIGCRVKLNGDLVITILSRACKELWNYDGFKQRHQIFIPFHFPPHRPVNGELPLQGRRHALVGRSYRESHPTENHQQHTYSASAPDEKTASVLKRNPNSSIYTYSVCTCIRN